MPTVPPRFQRRRRLGALLEIVEQLAVESADVWIAHRELLCERVRLRNHKEECERPDRPGHHQSSDDSNDRMLASRSPDEPATVMQGFAGFYQSTFTPS
jgi:hypothetical protein